ncbi:MAG: hypothetical protein KDH88_06805 [Chromatiales bacterium]|nr:hypothetical protein [Chromatiales bacterium]
MRRSPEFKAKALALTDRAGVRATAKQLDLHEPQLYGRRGKIRAEQAEALTILNKGGVLREEPEVLYALSGCWHMGGFILLMTGSRQNNDHNPKQKGSRRAS